MVWPVQGIYRMHTARLSVSRDDVVDLLAHPVGANHKHPASDKVAFNRARYKGRDYDLVGTSYDAATGQVTFAPKLTEAQRMAFRKSLMKPSQSRHEDSLKLQRDWIPRIINRYSHSPTADRPYASSSRSISGARVDFQGICTLFFQALSFREA